MEALLPTKRPQLISRINKLWENVVGVQFIGWTAAMRPEIHHLALVVQSTDGGAVNPFDHELNRTFSEQVNGGERKSVHMEVRYLREGVIMKDGLKQPEGMLYSKMTDDGLKQAHDRLQDLLLQMNNFMAKQAVDDAAAAERGEEVKEGAKPLQEVINNLIGPPGSPAHDEYQVVLDKKIEDYKAKAKEGETE